MLFEKEGIYTFDGKGELLITIMSSLAQEESRSISENITWGQRKSFSDGKVHLPYKRFLGYEKGEDGRPAVVESEARVVKLIYVQRLFIKAYNLMMQDRVQIIKQCEAWRARLMDFGTLDADIERQLEETRVVAELLKAAVRENASTAQSQEAYLKKIRSPHRALRKSRCGTGAVAKSAHRPLSAGQEDGTLYPQSQKTAGGAA